MSESKNIQKVIPLGKTSEYDGCKKMDNVKIGKHRSSPLASRIETIFVNHKLYMLIGRTIWYATEPLIIA